MGKTIRLRKGLNIPLAGEAVKIINHTVPTAFYAVKPPDFFHFIPKIVQSKEQK